MNQSDEFFQKFVVCKKDDMIVAIWLKLWVIKSVMWLFVWKKVSGWFSTDTSKTHD